MYKIVTILSCLLLLSPFFGYGAEAPSIDVAKLLAQKQEEHRDLIRNKGNLLDLYNKNLEALAKCSGDGDSMLNSFLGELQNEQEQFAAAIKTYGQRPYRMYTTYEIIPLLNVQAALIRNGLQLSKDNPEIQLKTKIAADCFSRLMVREFHSYTLDWTQEQPLREKNAKEEQDQPAHLYSSKNHIVKERNVAKALYGWIGVISSPFAAFFSYIAIKKPSLITGSLAVGATAWAGYHNYIYFRLKNLPCPSDDDVYQRDAICLKPKFE